MHPALQDTPTDPDGGATRRTLSQHAPLVIDRNKNGRDANWNEVSQFVDQPPDLSIQYTFYDQKMFFTNDFPYFRR